MSPFCEQPLLDLAAMAVRINKVYTRSGDDGRTGLVGGKRASKDDLRVHCYGEVDELNSVLGVVRATLAAPPYARRKAARSLDAVLGALQQELFDLGGELATPPGSRIEGMPSVGDEHVERLEGWIDELQPDLGELRSFILPGGGTAGALLHQARTVCRRAERSVTTLVGKRGASVWTVRYLNRLSDLLFVQARWIAAKTGHAETLWQHGLVPPAPRRRSKAKTTKPTRAKTTTTRTKKR